MQHLQPNTTLQGGIYRIERVLGQGGFGNTYMATNTIFDDHVAIKEFFMQGVNGRDENSGSITIGIESNTQQFEEQREKFKKEAKRLWKLKNEHIVKVHDLFEENGTTYYVMDFIDGGSLAEKMKKTGLPFTEADVRNILSQILEALKEVHQNEIWHLDLKPGNIMIDKNDNAYLIDFGASKQLRANGNMTTSTALCYTPGYAPNEQIGQMYDRFGPWTDIYALGATVYNLLTNKKPPMAIDIEENEEDAFEFLGNISMDMQKLVMWMMQPKRKARPQSVDEILTKLSITETEIRSFSKQNNEETVLIDSTPNDEETILADSDNNDNPQNSSQTLSPVIKDLINNMVSVEGGTFMMGRKIKWYEDSDEDEHEVSLSSYSINKYQVTQKEWIAIMKYNPSKIKGDDKPVTNVSWDDCMSFIHKLNTITGMKFRLPTEAEWEYASRGGNLTKGYKYAGSNTSDAVSWTLWNSNDITHEVGSKKPNELGLYDMCGNVWEWCQDYYGAYVTTNKDNPCGPTKGASRVMRGGCYFMDHNNCTVYTRGKNSPEQKQLHTGFRLSL